MVANMAFSVGLADVAHIEGQTHKNSLPAPAADREACEQNDEIFASECEIVQGEYERDTEMDVARSMGLM